MKKRFFELIKKCKTYKDLYDVPWKYFYGKKVDKNFHVNILLLNSVCNGFGDVVFCIKLGNYLKEWYNANVVIATPLPDGFKTVGGFAEENIYTLKGGKTGQCRRFKFLSLYDFSGKNKIDLPKFDLIFLAPLQADYDINLSDVKSIIPYSNKFNTFTFSEYNDSLDKKHDFNTGVGQGRCGIFLTNEKVKDKLSIVGKDKFAFLYVGKVGNEEKCILSFVEMILKKYKYKTFQIVLPKWVWEEILSDEKLKVFLKMVEKYRGGSVYVNDVLFKEVNKKKSSLIIRPNILPIPRNDILKLMKYSVRDILLTGDQSITDCLSCCPNKTIWYQTVPWKINFAKNISKELPQKYLGRISTSCGQIQNIRFKSKSYSLFKQNWDFRKLAKKKLDGIIKSVGGDKEMEDFKETVHNIKSLKNIKKKYK